MKKILVTGGGGVFARYVKESFSKYKTFVLNRNELDVTNYKQVKKVFEEIKPEIVVHLAARTNVDLSEQNPKDTYRVNYEGTKHITDASIKNNSFLIFQSTAAVFDGNKRSFHEDDIPNPLNVYGDSKLKAEEYIQSVTDKFIITRAAWMIGGGKEEKKFVSYIINQAKEKNEINVVNDKKGTIVYNQDLSYFIRELVEGKKTGIFHYGALGVVSRFDLAKEIIKLLKLKTKVIPVPSEYFASSFFAKRPNREVLKSKKITFKNHWKDSIKKYFYEELS